MSDSTSGSSVLCRHGMEDTSFDDDDDDDRSAAAEAAPPVMEISFVNNTNINDAGAVAVAPQSPPSRERLEAELGLLGREVLFPSSWDRDDALAALGNLQAWAETTAGDGSNNDDDDDDSPPACSSFLRTFHACNGGYRMLTFLRGNMGDAECVARALAVLNRCVDLRRGRDYDECQDDNAASDNGPHDFRGIVENDTGIVQVDIAKRFMAHGGVHTLLRADEEYDRVLAGTEEDDDNDDSIVVREVLENVWMAFRHMTGTPEIRFLLGGRKEALMVVDAACRRLRGLTVSLDTATAFDGSGGGSGLLVSCLDTLRHMMRHDETTVTDFESRKVLETAVDAILAFGSDGRGLRGPDEAEAAMALLGELSIAGAVVSASLCVRSAVVHLCGQVLADFPHNKTVTAYGLRILRDISSHANYRRVHLLSSADAAVARILQLDGVDPDTAAAARATLRCLCKGGAP